MKYTKMEWLSSNQPLMTTTTVHEQDKPAPVVIYDHTGQALIKQPPRMGFDLRPRGK